MSNEAINKTTIDAYYREMDAKTVYIDSIWELHRALKGFRKKNVIVPRSHLKGGHVLHRLQQKYRKYLAA